MAKEHTIYFRVDEKQNELIHNNFKKSGEKNFSEFMRNIAISNNNKAGFYENAEDKQRELLRREREIAALRNLQLQLSPATEAELRPEIESAIARRAKKK
jgi:hypothetical protein